MAILAAAAATASTVDFLEPQEAAIRRLATISAVVMTLNEEHNIDYCLRSVRPWCDEVVVVDMESGDATVSIARRYADVVLSHKKLEGFDAGRKLAFDSAAGEWILSIDADEVVTKELADWIRRFVDDDPPYDVALIPRVNVFLGQWIRSSPWWPGKPRLFRRGTMQVSEILHHGLVPMPGSRIARLPRDPDLSMWHFTLPSISAMMEKTNRYTTIEARQAIAAGKRDPSVIELLKRAARAMAPYLARRGYRDGWAGLAYSLDRIYYALMVALKRWDEPRAASRQAEYDRMRNEIVSAHMSPEDGRGGAV